MTSNEKYTNDDVQITFLVEDKSGCYRNIFERKFYLPNIPRMGEMVDIDSAKYLVRLVIQSVDGPEAFNPDVYLTLISESEDIKDYFFHI
ncbi:hypothetical protein [Dickeya dianthicola]|uniref:hypothetical protein n=1 Tax=Dickeya dianthicola TaxID=204039 RepID=UPI0030172DAB